MPLDKDVLGEALYNTRNTFSNKTQQQLIDTYGSLEAARLAACKAEAQTIIDHFKNNALLTIPGLGLSAGTTLVTGSSTTGTIG